MLKCHSIVCLQNVGTLLWIPLFLLFAGSETNMFFLLNEKEFLGSKDSINLQEEKHHIEKKKQRNPSVNPWMHSHTECSIVSIWIGPGNSVSRPSPPTLFSSRVTWVDITGGNNFRVCWWILGSLDQQIPDISSITQYPQRSQPKPGQWAETLS